MAAMYFGLVDTVLAMEESGFYDFPKSLHGHLTMATALYHAPGVQQWWEDSGGPHGSPHISAYLAQD